MSAETAITSSSIIGRALLALRAGPMSCTELHERLGTYPQTNSLERMGYVTRIDDDLRITDAGRAACPLRNPLAATMQKPVTTSHGRPSTPIGLPARTATPNPIRSPKPLETPRGIRMPNPARSHKPTAVDQVRRALINAPAGVARKDLIKRSVLSPAGVDNAILNLIKSGEAERKSYGVIAAIQSGIAVIAARLEQGEALAAAVAEQSAVELVAAAAPAADEPAAPEIEFMLHDDGRLTIADGDEILVLPPAATKRLGYFLGCLDEKSWPPRFAPAPTQPPPVA